MFFTNLVEDAITESKTIMKLYKFFADTDNLYLANVVYQMDFLYGGNMAMVEYEGVPVPRDDLLVNRILTTLNGQYVGRGWQSSIQYSDVQIQFSKNNHW